MPKNHAVSNLAEDRVVSEGNSVTTPKVSDDDQRVATEVFAGAVDSMKLQAKVAAGVLGLAAPHLSEYRNGVRPVTLHRVIRGARVNQSFGIALIRALANMTPDITVVVTKKRKADKQAVRAQMALTFEENPSLRRIAVADAAAKLGISEQEAEEILEEPTIERQFGINGASK